jgi:hypothetical protein
MTTINILTKEFGTNKVLAPAYAFTLPVDYTAVQYIGLKDAQGKMQDYGFVLWTFGGNFQTDPQIKMNSAAADITATAWYYAVDGVSKKTYAVGWAFSLDTGEFLVGEIPFDTVNPPDGWTATDSSVETTNHDVDITAKASIQKQSFEEWYSLSPAATTINGSQITVKSGNYVWIVAEYKTKSIRRPKPGVVTIPGEDSMGKQLMKFLGTAQVARIIKEFKLKPMSAKEMKVYSTKAPTQFRCAIGAPHLHFRGKTYLLKPNQWKTLASRVQKDLGKKLSDAKPISFDNMSEISKDMEKI